MFFRSPERRGLRNLKVKLVQTLVSNRGAIGRMADRDDIVEREDFPRTNFLPSDEYRVLGPGTFRQDGSR